MFESTQASVPRAATLRLVAEGTPPLPQNLTKLINLNRSDLEGARALILSDPSMAMDIVRLRNSALFAAATPVSDAVEAIAYLGTERAVNALLATTIARLFSGRVAWIKPLIDRAGLVAGINRAVAQAANLPAHEVEQAFTDGLLHDLGRLALALVFPNIESPLDESKARLWDFELEHYGMTHEQAGALLARQWELPRDLTLVMGRHGEPDAADIDNDIRPRIRRLEVSNTVAPAIARADTFESVAHLLHEDLQGPYMERTLELLRSERTRIIAALERAWPLLPRSLGTC